MTSKRRKWLLLLAGVTALAALVLFLTREREPSYEGKSLSEWVEIHADEWDYDYDPINQTASKAIRQIGTNALPFLLDWVSYEPSHRGLKKTLQDSIDKLPDDLKPDFLDSWRQGDFRERRAVNAARVFALFRDEAHLCIPSLVTLANDTNAPGASANAVYALASIGPAALPVLARQLADTNAPRRERVALALGVFPELATNPASPVTLLIPYLQDFDARVRSRAIYSLGIIGKRDRAQADVTVPALTNCLRDDFPLRLQGATVSALGWYSNDARIAVPLLLDRVNSPDLLIRTRVTNALLGIAPEVLTNAPAK